MSYLAPGSDQNMVCMCRHSVGDNAGITSGFTDDATASLYNTRLANRNDFEAFSNDH